MAAAASATAASGWSRSPLRANLPAPIRLVQLPAPSALIPRLPRPPTQLPLLVSPLLLHLCSCHCQKVLFLSWLHVWVWQVEADLAREHEALEALQQESLRWASEGTIARTVVDGPHPRPPQWSTLPLPVVWSARTAPVLECPHIRCC